MSDYKFFSISSFYNEPEEFQEVVNTMVGLEFPVPIRMEVEVDSYSEKEAWEADSNHGSNIYLKLDYNTSLETCREIQKILVNTINKRNLPASCFMVCSDQEFEAKF
jgi:hypothetical protein